MKAGDDFGCTGGLPCFWRLGHGQGTISTLFAVCHPGKANIDSNFGRYKSLEAC